MKWVSILSGEDHQFTLYSNCPPSWALGIHMIQAELFVERTSQKLRFSKVILDELAEHPSHNSGDDFERCHLEAFLFHLHGAVDAFMQELNIYYGCGLRVDKVSRRKLRESLANQDAVSVELAELEALEREQEHFLGLTKDIRHFVTHRGGLPMKHYFNGPSNIVHPVTGDEFQSDSIGLLRGWLKNTATIIEKWRETAHREIPNQAFNTDK